MKKVTFEYKKKSSKEKTGSPMKNSKILVALP